MNVGMIRISVPPVHPVSATVIVVRVIGARRLMVVTSVWLLVVRMVGAQAIQFVVPLVRMAVRAGFALMTQRAPRTVFVRRTIPVATLKAAVAWPRIARHEIIGVTMTANAVSMMMLSQSP